MISAESLPSRRVTHDEYGDVTRRLLRLFLSVYLIVSKSRGRVRFYPGPRKQSSILRLLFVKRSLIPRRNCFGERVSS